MNSGSISCIAWGSLTTYLNFSFITYKMGILTIPIETSRDFARLYEITHIKALGTIPDTEQVIHQC